MKMKLAIGLVFGIMACATAGIVGVVSAQEEPQSDGAVSTQVKSQWDGIYSEDQATRGGPLYQELCASCHGPDLHGMGDMGPGLVGGDFAANWNDQTLDQVFDRIRISMPQNNPGSLSRQQTADILAFMLQNSLAPSGADDLSTQPEVLSTIKYLARDPKTE